MQIGAIPGRTLVNNVQASGEGQPVAGQARRQCSQFGSHRWRICSLSHGRHTGAHHLSTETMITEISGPKSGACFSP